MAEIKPYNDRIIEKLVAEGLSYAEAGYEAGATMDGADEVAGNVVAQQTACGFLRYDEFLEDDSREMIEAREKTIGDAEAEAKKLGFESLKNYYNSLGMTLED